MWYTLSHRCRADVVFSRRARWCVEKSRSDRKRGPLCRIYSGGLSCTIASTLTFSYPAVILAFTSSSYRLHLASPAPERLSMRLAFELHSTNSSCRGRQILFVGGRILDVLREGRRTVHTITVTGPGSYSILECNL